MDQENQEITVVENLEDKKQMTRQEVFENENFQASLHGRISINQRFMFLQELFDSNVEEYENVINKIDQLTNIGEVHDFLTENVINKYDWDYESDEVIEFMNLIRLRFT